MRMLLYAPQRSQRRWRSHPLPEGYGWSETTSLPFTQTGHRTIAEDHDECDPGCDPLLRHLVDRHVPTFVTSVRDEHSLSLSDGDGLLIHAAVGIGCGVGRPRTKRSGCAWCAAASTVARSVRRASARP